jgi:hypothetical protein
MLPPSKSSLSYNTILFARLLLKNKRNSTARQIINALFQRKNLSLNSSYSKDRLIGLREFFRVISNSQDSPQIWTSNSKNDFVLIVSGETSIDKISQYISAQSKKDVSDIIEKSNVRLKHIYYSISDLFIYFLFALPIVFLCFFSNKRTHISILLRYVVEFTYLSQFVEKRQKPQTLLFFNPFVGDTPLCCHFLKVNFKSNCIIIPSITPLSLINSYSIADEIIISSEYHREEMLFNSNLNITANKVTYWLPEGCYELKSETNEKSNLDTIGFYSHGQWIRNQQNKSFGRSHLQAKEENVLTQLNHYVKQNNIQLIIFLHPWEIVNEQTFEQTKQYYSHFVDPENLHFNLSKKKNIESSLHVFLGVGVFSSILLERLSLGLPCFIAEDLSWEFPLKNSKLHNISFNAFDTSLANKIESIKNLSTTQFFCKFDLADYIKQ